VVTCSSQVAKDDAISAARLSGRSARERARAEAVGETALAAILVRMDAEGPDPDRRAFAAALDDLEGALDRAAATQARIRERMGMLREQLDAGRPVHDIVSVEQPPPIVRLLTEATETIHSAGTRVRRTLARVLYREGLTMEEIARMFGVSRQRVSILLRGPSGAR
jgi:hypothetical protein